MGKAKSLLLVLSLLLASISRLQAEKHALIIAIGQYQPGSGWNPLDVELDVDMMRAALQKQGFAKERQVVLRDANATKDRILQAFKVLAQKAQPGDIVFIHYSGHGQQITDLSGDEGDGLDEAICPYDSRTTFSDGYRGECHLLDDEIRKLLKAISNKVGRKGEVIYAVDACHSGSGVRGPKMRGVEKPFVIPQTAKRGMATEKDPNNFLEAEIPDNLMAFFGSASGQANYQIWYNGGQQMGSLSYALANALNQLTEKSSYQDLAVRVKHTIVSRTHTQQQPTTSGNLQRRVFKGHLDALANHYQVLQVGRNPKRVRVNASLFEAVDVGSVLAFCPPTVDEWQPGKALALGKVVKAGHSDCWVLLDKALKEQQLLQSHVFVAERKYRLKPLKVAVSGTNAAWVKAIQQLLNEFDTLVQIDATAPYIVVSDSTKPDDVVPDRKRVGTHYVYLPEAVNALESRRVLHKVVVDHLMAQYILEQQGENPDLQAQVQLINPATRKPYLEKNGTIQLQEGNRFQIKVSNPGDYTFFFNLLYVQSDGQYTQLEPRIGDRHVESTECQIKPYSSLTIEHVFTASEPFGKDIMVVVLEPEEINKWPRLVRMRREVVLGIPKGRRGIEEVDSRGLGPREGARIFQVMIEVKKR